MKKRMKVKGPFRKTKIVCTIGPACNNEKTLRAMFRAGMNVGRFNFSHGTYEDHDRNITLFRKVRDELGISAAVLLDTKGPEIRLKKFRDGGCELLPHSDFTLTTREVEGTSEIASITYEGLPGDVKPGDTILIDDGKIMLKVEAVSGTDILTKVSRGGEIKDHKGINVPNVHLTLPYLSKQDKNDLLFGIEYSVDFVAASFARSGEDMRELRAFLDANGGGDIKILAKIENNQGIENFEEILKIADGIMIARGDMGVEVQYERLPWIQKRLTRRCVQSGKTVITATQMLESMITSPVPTRAEVTDVANAVFDGTSAVMLSAETAAGSYPVQAVGAMAKIALQAEQDAATVLKNEVVWHEMDVSDITNAVGHAACTLAEDVHAAAVVAVTQSGFTARRTAKFRPRVPIIGATPVEKTYHQLSLEWGVWPLRTEEKERILELFHSCVEGVVDAGMAAKGSRLVITAGVPIGRSGDTNMIRVMEA